MPTPNRPKAQAEYSEQYMQNSSLDEDFGVLTREILGYDGTNLQRLAADALNTKITTDGDVVYIGLAAPGTAQATTKWQAKKIDQTDADNITITWADGGAFSQAATDLTGLSYA